MTRLTRRAVLASAAATVALPFLPSLVGRARAEGEGPVRVVYWFVPNGMHMPEWTPRDLGSDWTPGRILEPLADLKEHLLVLSGVDNLPADIGEVAGGHSRGVAAWLTCQTPSADQVEVGTSADQVLAAAIGPQTRLSSLQLGTEAVFDGGTCDGGYPCAYVSSVSWSGPKLPVPNITSPRAAFYRMFQGWVPGLSQAEREREARWGASLLDHVADDTQRLARRLSSQDRGRLDEYLTALREVERALTAADSGQCEPDGPPEDTPDLARRFDQFSDLIALALRCDLTRVVTFMAANGASGRSFPWLGIPESHHDLSHHFGLPERHEALVTIGRWHMERLGVLLRALRDTPDGDGSLLDRSVVVCGSEISDGNTHSHRDLPVLLAGRAGGAITPGRHLDLGGRPLADVHLSLLRAAGARVDAFGLDGIAPVEALAG